MREYSTFECINCIAYYGMDSEVGYININGVIDAKENPADTKHYHGKIDTALEKWMQEGEKSAISLVEKHWEKIENLSKQLLEEEIIYEDELNKILA